MMYWDSGWGAFGWLFMGLWMVLFWGVIIWAVVALVRRDSGGTTPASSRERSPREILDERLARGEIDVDEYRTRLDTLERL